MISWTVILTIVNLVIALGVIFGGYIAIRSTMAKTASDIQDRVREALESENNLLRERLKRLEADNKHLNRLMLLIISTLKKTHSIELEINDDVIILRDKNGTKAVQIHITGDLPPKEEEKP